MKISQRGKNRKRDKFREDYQAYGKRDWGRYKQSGPEIKKERKAKHCATRGEEENRKKGDRQGGRGER